MKLTPTWYVIPRERLVRPRSPILLLVWQRQRSWGTFSQDTADMMNMEESLIPDYRVNQLRITCNAGIRCGTCVYLLTAWSWFISGLQLNHCLYSFMPLHVRFQCNVPVMVSSTVSSVEASCVDRQLTVRSMWFIWKFAVHHGQTGSISNAVSVSQHSHKILTIQQGKPCCLGILDNPCSDPEKCQFPEFGATQEQTNYISHSCGLIIKLVAVALVMFRLSELW